MELYINMPEEFMLMMEVMIEAEFIYANLPIVMDKILEYIVNLFIQQFTQIISTIIDQLLGIWK